MTSSLLNVKLLFCGARSADLLSFNSSNISFMSSIVFEELDFRCLRCEDADPFRISPSGYYAMACSSTLGSDASSIRLYCEGSCWASFDFVPI